MKLFHVFRFHRPFSINSHHGARLISKSTLADMPVDITTDPEFVHVEEGKVKIYQPASVFYNKVQEFNRDLSVLVIDTYIKTELWKAAKRSHYLASRDIKVLDALSATGLRAVRYAKEVQSSNDRKILVFGNDILPQATEVITKNAELNGVGDKVVATNDDAALLMYKNRRHEDRFRVVDIDPYGSPAPFIDAAVQCVDDGGLLLVTCTDMAILCGNHPETCYAKYGSMSLKIPSCHEQALRIVLRSIESHANKYGRHIVPLLSLSIDFYIRIIVQVFTGPLQAKDSASKTGNIFVCQGCHTHSFQKLATIKKVPEGEKPKFEYNAATGPVVNQICDHCGWNHSFAGPLWMNPIHSLDFITKLQENLTDDRFKTSRRIRGMLQLAKEELPDVPLYHHLDSMTKVLRCPIPPMAQARSALMNAGYRVSYTHACKNSLKTDAPNSFIWNMLRRWVEVNSTKKEMVNNCPGKVILSKPCSDEVSFEIRSDQEPLSMKGNMLRFQANPERNWGPKSKPPSKVADNAKKMKIDN